MGPDTMILVILQEGYSKFIFVGESLLAHKLQVNTTHPQLSSVRGLIHAVWCFVLLILSLSLKWREECVLSRFNHVRLFETLRTSSPPGSSVQRFPLERILEWVVMPSSRRSSPPWDRTPLSYISCIGRRVLYHLHYLGKPRNNRQ